MFSLLICFIFLRINNNNQPVSFKKRNKYKILIPKLIFGDCGLFFLKNYNLEIIYFFQLKKKIKIFLKKNKF
jgi:hypothetical protein